ncbi:hypothetical protein T439DRAFT_187123 [Meredithblackwellia eburnea MCA 4105]
MSFPFQPIDPLIPPSSYEGDTLATDMASLHNVIIAGLNSIHEQASKVVPSDVQPFMGYTASWITLVQSHHHTEETYLFPFLSKLYDDEITKNIEEHERFLRGLESLNDYVKQVRGGDKSFNPDEVQNLLDTFAGTLVHHLKEEISTLVPEKMAKFDRAEFKQCMEVMVAHIKTQGGLTTIFPFVVTHYDPISTISIPGWSWPPLPSLLIFLTRNVFFWVNSSWWKFSPYDRHGQPQTYSPS